MPLALVGLLSCLAVWEAFRFCDDKWSLDHFPIIRQVLVRVGQCGEFFPTDGSMFALLAPLFEALYNMDVEHAWIISNV